MTNGTLRTLVYRRRALAGESATQTWRWGTARAGSGAIVTTRNTSDDDATWAVNDSTGAGSYIEEPSVNVPLVDGLAIGIAAQAANTAIAPPTGHHRDRGRARRPAAASRSRTRSTRRSATRATGSRPGSGSATGSGCRLRSLHRSNRRDLLRCDLRRRPRDADRRGPGARSSPGPDVRLHGDRRLPRRAVARRPRPGVPRRDQPARRLATPGGARPRGRDDAGPPAPGVRRRRRHFEDTVILRKGRHLAGSVERTKHGTGLRTRALVEGSGGRVIEVVDPAARDRREHRPAGRLPRALDVGQRDHAPARWRDRARAGRGRGRGPLAPRRPRLRSGALRAVGRLPGRRLDLDRRGRVGRRAGGAARRVDHARGHGRARIHRRARANSSSSRRSCGCSGAWTP